jgi:hypothetical protein
METVLGILGIVVGAALILNAVFLWFPPPPKGGSAMDSAGRRIVIRGIGVFGLLSAFMGLKFLGVF